MVRVAAILAPANFADGRRIRDLQKSCAMIPEEPGIYAVVRETMEPVRFLDASTGGHFKGQNPSVAVAKLRRRWLTTTNVLYIGKAGGSTQNSNLRDRIRSYVQFGIGSPCAHWGGRYVWQLADAAEMFIYWRTTPDLEPARMESALLEKFGHAYGRLPFANLRR